MTAPNSPRPAAKAVTAPARMPGEISGSVTVRKRSTGPAPRVRAAASSPGSTLSMPRRTARTISGKDITAVASAAPSVVKTRRMPNQSLSGPPIGPRTPNSISSPQPTTTGGTTSGRWTNASSSIRPGKRPRASSQATATAGTRETATDRVATSRLSRTACHSSGVSRTLTAPSQSRSAASWARPPAPPGRRAGRALPRCPRRGASGRRGR